MSEAYREITAADFETVIKKGVSVVKFGANWCAPCNSYDVNVLPFATAAAASGKVVFAKVDIEAAENKGSSESIAMKRKSGEIAEIPHIVIFKDGEPVATVVGLNLKEVVSSVEKALKK